MAVSTPEPAPNSDFDAVDRRAWFRRALPDYGPDWQAAIEMGIDVVELDRRLQWTAAERLAALCAMQRAAGPRPATRGGHAEH